MHLANGFKRSHTFSRTILNMEKHDCYHSYKVEHTIHASFSLICERICNEICYSQYAKECSISDCIMIAYIVLCHSPSMTCFGMTQTIHYRRVDTTHVSDYIRTCIYINMYLAWINRCGTICSTIPLARRTRNVAHNGWNTRTARTHRSTPTYTLHTRGNAHRKHLQIQRIIT